MEVKACRNCKRLFKYIYGSELCPDCIKLIPKEEKDIIKKNRLDKEFTGKLNPIIREYEEKYGQVKDYIMANPKATIDQISEANNITPKMLLEWVRQDRLEFSKDSKDAWFECEKCGTKIKSGRLCNQCKIM